MRDPQRQVEMGRFLRARRLALQPEELGLRSHPGRRRTPGLRREEVAERAAISVSWYTWLEQGRDIHVSDAVLDSVAEALQLDGAQREYLYCLASGNGAHVAQPTDRSDLPASVQRILDAQAPSPGYAINRRFEVIGWNGAALAVFGDFAQLPVTERNVLRLIFGMLRPLITNWEPNARFLLSTFRANTSTNVSEPWWCELVKDLGSRNPEFRCWWSEYSVGTRPVAYKELAHPVVGRMVLEQTALLSEDGSGRRLVLYTPKPGTETSIKLTQLAQQR